MACSSCGQKRAVVTEAQAQAVASGGYAAPVYVVVSPDGSRTEFSEYIDAAVYRVQVNGTLTTTTSQPG